jgi:hypothetical protein
MRHERSTHYKCGYTKQPSLLLYFSFSVKQDLLIFVPHLEKRMSLRKTREMRVKLISAIQLDQTETLRHLLSKPEADIYDCGVYKGSRKHRGLCPLYLAVIWDRFDCLKIMTELPDFDPNRTTSRPIYYAPNILAIGEQAIEQASPLQVAMHFGRRGCFELLLSHPRVDINHKVARSASVTSTVVSDALRMKDPWYMELIISRLGDKIEDRIELFQFNKRQQKIIPIRLSILASLPAHVSGFQPAPLALYRGLANVKLAAAVLAGFVFISDGYLRIALPNTPSGRVCAIAAQLPLELQTLLANIIMGSTKETILSKMIEPAFRKLARAWAPKSA